jgi:hypothetical protein
MVLRIPHFLSPDEIADVMEYSFEATQNGSFAPQGSSSTYLRAPGHKDSVILRSLAHRAASLVGALSVLSKESSNSIVVDDVLAAAIPHNMSLLEPFSLTRYTQGQHYGIHHDSVFVARSWTLLFYLNSLKSEEGGATVFPDLTSKSAEERHTARCGEGSSDSSLPTDRSGGDGPLTSACVDGHVLSVQPQEGSVLIFENTV